MGRTLRKAGVRLGECGNEREWDRTWDHKYSNHLHQEDEHGCESCDLEGQDEKGEDGELVD
jgi:hypothetical protein